MKKLLTLVLVLLIMSCNNKADIAINEEDKSDSLNEIETQTISDDKIAVLNFATFHMGYTPDAKSVKFDEHNKKNKDTIHQLAKMISKFKPTVILVETIPSYDKELQKNYAAYLENPDTSFKDPNEVELLAFEVGRLSGTKNIYGIDHKMGYNYRIGYQIENAIDDTTYKAFLENPFKANPELGANMDMLPLKEKLLLINNDAFLDFLTATNADMLTHIGTKDNFEGADEAAKFYQRNLRIYSNLNRIDLKKDDRVFIIMGGAHTAMFRDFMSRSPKYKMVNTFDFIK